MKWWKKGDVAAEMVRTAYVPLINLNAQVGKKDAQPIPCPRCTARDRAYRMMELSSFYPGPEERVTGYGIECQGCGHIYCVGEHGSWEPSANSTLGRQLRREVSRGTPNYEDPKPSVDLDNAGAPDPLDRPRV